MTYRIAHEMVEAARLTGLGKLAEATALIQRLLQGDSAGDSERDASASAGDDELVSADGDDPQAQPKAQTAEPHRFRPRTSLRESLRFAASMAGTVNLDGIVTRRTASEPIPSGASFAAGTFSNAAGTRGYKLYIPSILASERVPLVVMLHGCTQGPDDFAAGTRMNTLAEEQGFLAVYPAQDASANAKHCWNWFNPDDQRRDRGEPSLIAGITLHIIGNHPVDPARVYIAGLSAGGAAAAIMGNAYPDLYAAVGVHSGLPSGAALDLPSAFDAMRFGAKASETTARVIPTIVFHGQNDRIVHPNNGDAVTAQVVGASKGWRQTTRRGQTSDGRVYSRITYDDPEGRTMCEQWKIDAAGHAWSGGSPLGSHTDPRGPNASREMVRFFFQNRTGG